MLDRGDNRPIAFRPGERFPCGIQTSIHCICSIDTTPRLPARVESEEREEEVNRLDFVSTLRFYPRRPIGRIGTC